MACDHRLWAAQTVELRRAWHAIFTLGRQTWSNDVESGMPSSPLASTQSQTTSGVACHHRLGGAHRIERCRAFHAIIAFGQHTRSNDVGHGMPSRLWVAHTVERRRAWHAIIALGRQTPSNDVKRGMPSSPLGSTNGQTMSGVACHNIPWTTHMVGRRRAWHAIIAFVQHTRSNNVGRGMPSSPSGSTHDRTTSGVACHHCRWAAHTVE